MGRSPHGGTESWKCPQSPCSTFTMVQRLAFFWDPSRGPKTSFKKKHNAFYRANSETKSMFRGRCKCSYCKYLRASMGGHRGRDSQFQPNLHIFPFYSEGGWEQWGEDMESGVDPRAKKRKRKQKALNEAYFSDKASPLVWNTENQLYFLFFLTV